MMRCLLLTLSFWAIPLLAIAKDTDKQFYTFVPDKSLSTLGLLFAIAMILFFLYTGWLSKRKNTDTDAYYTAGRGVGALSNGLAMTSNFLSLATFLGFTALIWKLQFLLTAFVLSWICGFVLVTVSVAPSLRRWGKYSTMQFVGERFGHTAKIISIICMILLAQLYLIGQMKGIGNLFQIMFHMKYTTGMIVGGLVVTCYVTIGGMYGLSYNQTVQCIILMIGLVLPTTVILMKMGAGPSAIFTPFGYGKLAGDMIAALPTYFDPFTTAAGKVPLTFKYYAGIWLTLAMGTIGLPHIAMRYFTAPSVKEAKYAGLWGGFFVGFAMLSTFAIGFAAKLYTVNVLNRQGLHIQPKDADLLVVIMSQVFAPSWIAALPVAGALAAGMSTIAGLLMVIGNGIGHDIYVTIKPDATADSKVKMGYIFTAIGGIVTILLALSPPDFLLTSVIWAYVVSCSTFTPILILGIWWKGTNKQGAISGMSIGLVLSIVMWWTKGSLFGIDFIKLGPLAHLVAGIFTASCAWFVTIVVSWATGGEKNRVVLKAIDGMHGWVDHHPERYNSKVFPIVAASMALLLMIWSAMPQ